MDTRWWVLVFCSLLSFATDYFSEEPTVLVQRLTGTSSSCSDGTDYCQYLNLQQYNAIFAYSAWAAAVTAIVGGVAADRYGCKWPLITAGLFVAVGAFVFVAGTYVPNAEANKAALILILGRVIFNLGTGATGVITLRVEASWFLHKELALAFSIHILCGRLGSAVSFILTGYYLEKIGMQYCLWIGFAFVLVSTSACIGLGYLDENKAGYSSPAAQQSNIRIVWNDLKSFDAMYWWCAVLVFFFFGTMSAFTANGPNFLAVRYGYSEAVSSYIFGIIYDITITGIVFGWLTDRWGYREFWLFASIVLFVAAFLGELCIPEFPSWLFTALLGLSYTIFGPTIWSSVPLFTTVAAVGGGIGILKFFSSIGTGVLTVIAGALLEKQNIEDGSPWFWFLVMLVSGAGICLISNVAVVYLNTRTGCRLTPSQAARERALSLTETTPLLPENRAVVSRESSRPSSVL